jgi:hypothetical protein
MSWHVKLDICLEVAHKSMRWTNEQYHRFEIMNVLQTRSSEQILELMRARNCVDVSQIGIRYLGNILRLVSECYEAEVAAVVPFDVAQGYHDPASNFSKLLTLTRKRTSSGLAVHGGRSNCPSLPWRVSFLLPSPSPSCSGTIIEGPFVAPQRNISF